jgi:glycosyltransferase involved in cell wall biosynthesis
MNVLVISFYFPPLNQIASYRAYSFARALAESGCAVTVLTCEKTPALGDLSLAHSREGLEMIEVPIDTPPESARSRWVWTLRAARALRRCVRSRPVDLVVSSHGPSSSHVLGGLAARIGRRPFWVADYRDPWTTNRYDRPVSRLDPLKRGVEHRLVSRAGLITTVSRACAADLAALVPEVPVRVVPNGFDRAVAAGRSERASSGPALLAFTGTIYPNKRENAARLLVEVIADLAREGLSPDALRVVFAGSNLHLIDELVRVHGVEPFVSTAGMLPRDEAHALQDRSDALLLLEDGEAARDGVLTGKIYEYLASGVPTLVIGPDASTEIGELIAGTGGGICLGTDRAAIASVLRRIAEGDTANLCTPRPEVIARYARARIAGDFVEMVRSMGVPLPRGEAARPAP